MRLTFRKTSALVTILLVLPCLAMAAEENFYRGKTLRFIVGSSPGGGYDTYTRLIARHIVRFIPGSPSSIVENMPGAGGLIAANYVYKRADADGSVVGIFNNSNILRRGLGDPLVNVDFMKLGWIGAPSIGEPMCMIMAFTGMKTLDDVMNANKPIKMGANRAGSTGHDLPLILNKTLGTKFDVIAGYSGTATTRVALQSREIEGFCSQWESMRVTARSMLDAEGEDKLIPFLMNSKWGDPEVKNLPLIKDVIKDPQKLAVYKGWSGQMDFQRPLSVPAGTPKDRIQVLRKAFAEVLKDPQLLAEAEKSKLVMTYVSGEQTEQLVKEMLSMPAEVKESLSFLIRKKGK